MTDPPRKRKSMFRYYDPERDKRDAATTLEHENAVARGEKRTLLHTTEGEMYSYQSEEIGFTTGGTGPVLASGPGMLLAGTLCWISAVWLVVYVFLTGDATTGEWVGLSFLAGSTVALGYYFNRMGMREHHARKLRKARGLPAPNLDLRR